MTEIFKKHPCSCSEQTMLVLGGEFVTWSQPVWLFWHKPAFNHTNGAEGHPPGSYLSCLNPQHAEKTYQDFKGKSTKKSQISWGPRVYLSMCGPTCLKPHLTLTGRQMSVRWSSLPIFSRINVLTFHLPSSFQLSLFSLHWIGLNFATDPLDVIGDAGIDPRLVPLSAPVAPADHAHQSHPVVISTDERTPRISLWLKFKREKRQKEKIKLGM